MKKGVLSYGVTDSSSMDAATLNFIGAAMNTLSLCCTPIELLSNDGEDSIVSSASGFFWAYRERPYLITNWHVISGRNPFTGNIISETGYIPQKIRFFGVSYSLEGKNLAFSRKPYVISLPDDTCRQISKPPTVAGHGVDVLALPIPTEAIFKKNGNLQGFVGAEKLTCFINEAVGRPIVTRAGDDCFLLGYPLRNYDGLKLPIWKRGSIASETNIGVDGRPIFLVDAATTSAMSGCPILRKAITVTAENRDIGAVQEFTNLDIIGIYAGRLQSSDLAATNIGYGWYKTLIDQVIESFASITVR